MSILVPHSGGQPRVQIMGIFETKKAEVIQKWKMKYIMKSFRIYTHPKMWTGRLDQDASDKREREKQEMLENVREKVIKECINEF